MIGLSILGGIVAGLGAVFFRGLIGFVHNVFFLGRLSSAYNANAHTAAGPWGPFVILVPALGAVGVTFLVTRFAPEAKGHGVPEVMDSVHYGKGIIRPAVAVVKALASALCIGSGGSVGREGPIVQIGSSFGSMIGQFLPMTQKQRTTLLAAGADRRHRGDVQYAHRWNSFRGGADPERGEHGHPGSGGHLRHHRHVYRPAVFRHPSLVRHPTPHRAYSPLESPQLLVSYVVLGILMGGASAVCVRILYFVEDFFGAHSFKNPYLRHASAMAVVGVMFSFLMRSTHAYHIEGVGYATVQDILTGSLTSLPLLLVLFVMKLAATSLTLGPGGSGGVFPLRSFWEPPQAASMESSSRMVFPSLGIRPEAFAVAGMAGMIGGTTGAALTSIVISI